MKKGNLFISCICHFKLTPQNTSLLLSNRRTFCFSEMANEYLFLLAFVASLRFKFVSSFNLDSKDAFVYKGAAGEYFGYSVALHAQGKDDRW